MEDQSMELEMSQSELDEEIIEHLETIIETSSESEEEYPKAPKKRRISIK